MGELAWHMSIGLGVVVTLLVGPGLAVLMISLRKRRARQARRSPIGIDLLRGPGHSLRERIEEAHSDAQTHVSILMVIPMTVLAVFLAQAHARGLSGMQHLIPFYVLGVIGVVGITARKVWMISDRLDRERLGYDAEVAVGQELDQLMRQGAAVFHDFPAENFNIDHIVISRRGVFAVETKGYSKPSGIKGKAGATVGFDGKSLRFPTWTTREPLEQAERQAQWLTKWLAQSAAEQVSVMPVLALPGWFVERGGRGPVRVYSGRELSGLLDARGAAPLSEDTMQRIVYQVEQRCRSVAPTSAKKA